MPLSISKTYLDTQILTETDLDNLYSTLLTLVNITKLDETYFNLDQIISSLTEVQVSNILNTSLETQADIFIGKSTSAGVEILQSKRLQLVSSITLNETSVYHAPTNKWRFYRELFEVPNTSANIYVISISYTVRLEWFSTRTSSVPLPGDTITARFRSSAGTSNSLDTPRFAPYDANNYFLQDEISTQDVFSTIISGSSARAAIWPDRSRTISFISNPNYEAPTSPKSIFVLGDYLSVSASSGTAQLSEFTFRCLGTANVWRVV